MLEALLSTEVSWAVRHELGFEVLGEAAAWAQLLRVQGLFPALLLAFALLVAPLGVILPESTARSLRGLLGLVVVAALAVVLPATTALVAALGAEGGEASPGGMLGAGLAASLLLGLAPLGLQERRDQLTEKAGYADLLIGLVALVLVPLAYLGALQFASLVGNPATLALYGLLLDVQQVEAVGIALLVLGVVQVIAGLSLATSGLSGVGPLLASLGKKSLG